MHMRSLLDERVLFARFDVRSGPIRVPIKSKPLAFPCHCERSEAISISGDREIASLRSQRRGIRQTTRSIIVQNIAAQFARSLNQTRRPREAWTRSDEK